MGKAFASGKHAFGFCDICGFRYPLHELKTEVINLEQTDTRACPECWSPDNPQTQLGRHHFDDPQALRNPRPNGATAGRNLPAAVRWDFSTGTALTSPTRIDGWWASNGVLTWNSSSETLNLISQSDPSTFPSAGDPWLNQGFNGASVAPAPLSIDASVYKYVVSVFKVNRFPDIEPDDRYKYDFQGNLFWSKDTTTISRVDISSVSIDRSGNGIFTLAVEDTGPSVGDRVQLNSITGSYPKYGGGSYNLTGTVSTGGINSIPPTGADSARDNWMVTVADSTTFTLAGLEVDGETIDGDSSSLAISGDVGPTYPWGGGGNDERHSLDTSPYIPNYQASDGFKTVDRDMAGWFKVVWDMTDNPQWLGTITGLRLDYFDARNGEGGVPDYDAGDIDIDYIEVVAFHNPDL